MPTIAIENARAYLGIDYADEVTDKNITRCLKTAQSILHGAVGEDLELNRPIFLGKISIKGILTPPICASWKWKPHPGRGRGLAKPVVRPARLGGGG